MKYELLEFFNSEFAKRSRFHWDFISNIKSLENWNILSNQYQIFLDCQKVKNIDKEYLIPKIIHQIWIGNKKLPNNYIKYMRSWKKYNPSWDYILWDDEKVKNLKLKNDFAYYSSSNYGYKSDILRYEILHKFGGLYADTDFECLKPIPDNLLIFDFIVSMMFGNEPTLGNALILSSPKNKLIRKLINNITTLNTNSSKEVFEKSGPNYISKNYFLISKEEIQNYLVLPSNYLYPRPNFIGDNSYNEIEFKKEYSLAIHHWGMSWFKDSKLLSIAKFLYRLMHINKLKKIFISFTNLIK